MLTATGIITDPPTAGWLFEVVGPLLWLGAAVFFARQSWWQRQLTRGALLFIACSSMWWLEWTADWALYIVYNPHFAVMSSMWSWTPWTTPNRPWGVVPAYGWFFVGVMLLYCWIMDRVRRRWPDATWQTSVLVGIVFFYLADLVVEYGAARLGMWSYDHFVGPALQSPSGNYPLIYPVLVLVAWLTLMGVLIDSVDANGWTGLDRLLGARRWVPKAAGQAAAATASATSDGGLDTLERTRITPTQRLRTRVQVWRLVGWIVAWNVSYALMLLTFVVIRTFVVGYQSTLIP